MKVIFNVDVNASKAVLTVDKKMLLKDKFGLDVIFSGYSLTVSGAKVENSTEVFANLLSLFFDCCADNFACLRAKCNLT